jgi:hypothetical protein
MVCCVFHRLNRNFVLEQRLREIFELQKEKVAGGWTELYSEELNDLYCSVDGGGW